MGEGVGVGLYGVVQGLWIILIRMVQRMLFLLHHSDFIITCTF